MPKPVFYHILVPVMFCLMLFGDLACLVMNELVDKVLQLLVLVGLSARQIGDVVTGQV